MNVVMTPGDNVLDMASSADVSQHSRGPTEQTDGLPIVLKTVCSDSLSDTGSQGRVQTFNLLLLHLSCSTVSCSGFALHVTHQHVQAETTACS